MKKFLIAAIFMAVCMGWGSPAQAQPANYTFQISLVGVVEDTANAGLLGKPNWYQWIYRVEAVPGGTTHNGLSHFTLGLEDCFNESLLETLASTAGANSGNLMGLTGNIARTYTVETGNDGSTGIYGIKWNLDTNNFQTVGDYDYFWFSAPTDAGVENIGLVKHGRRFAETTLLTPDCPECTPVATPEPSTMLLFGTGVLGFLARKRKK